MALDRDLLVHLYRTMLKIRRFEETAQREGQAGRMPGFMHLYAGEEAVATGVCAHLTESDYITSTHRGHGHCLAKGASVKGMIAELYARSTGVCRGRGGSMHMYDFSKGILGANGIVGAGLPLACGTALTARLAKTDQVTVGFLGDGATNAGAFHESLNLSAIWDLPVVWVVENNLYGEATPLEFVTKVPDLTLRAVPYGIPALAADGQDVLAVYAAAGEAVARARSGGGPTLLVCNTYRYSGHFVGDAAGYRTREEEAAYRALDCLERFKSQGHLTADELSAIEAELVAEIVEALAFAAESPWPDPSEVLTDVYTRL